MAVPAFDLTRGACRGADTELFFPLKADSPALEAKAYCNGAPGQPACPVRTECLRWALDNREEHGVFGGLTASERRESGKPKKQGAGVWRDCDNPDCDVRFLTADPAKRSCSATCGSIAHHQRARNREQVAA